MMTTTTIAVPTSCAALCAKLAELAQHIEDDLAQADSGAAIDYGAIEQRVAEALGEIERGLHAQVLIEVKVEGRSNGGERGHGQEKTVESTFSDHHPEVASTPVEDLNGFRVASTTQGARR
jgi:hypothetical protein